MSKAYLAVVAAFLAWFGGLFLLRTQELDAPTAPTPWFSLDMGTRSALRPLSVSCTDWEPDQTCLVCVGVDTGARCRWVRP